MFFMKKALRLATRGAGMTSPNPLVGAVVVNGDAIAGKGYHRKFGGPHAEVNAIADAGSAARGGVLYVTLEPCNHYGHTPPCTKAILDAGIARVVFGMGDPNPGVAGGGDGFGGGRRRSGFGRAPGGGRAGPGLRLLPGGARPGRRLDCRRRRR